MLACLPIILKKTRRTFIYVHDGVSLAQVRPTVYIAITFQFRYTIDQLNLHIVLHLSDSL